MPNAHLRRATEDDVLRALEDAYIALPITTAAEALELFNRMLNVIQRGDGSDSSVSMLEQTNWSIGGSVELPERAFNAWVENNPADGRQVYRPGEPHPGPCVGRTLP